MGSGDGQDCKALPMPVLAARVAVVVGPPSPLSERPERLPQPIRPPVLRSLSPLERGLLQATSPGSPLLDPGQ